MEHIYYQEEKANGIFYTFVFTQSNGCMLGIKLYARETTNAYNESILKYLYSSNFEIQMIELTSKTVNARGGN